nr:MAG TPA: hypothetical protein [Siphoviridae sp. ctKRf14]
MGSVDRNPVWGIIRNLRIVAICRSLHRERD